MKYLQNFAQFGCVWIFLKVVGYISFSNAFRNVSANSLTVKEFRYDQETPKWQAFNEVNGKFLSFGKEHMMSYFQQRPL